jgi:type II secretory ATPase GspE/PulE/Tfp pilus assembly ATPase PilB-like protein
MELAAAGLKEQPFRAHGRPLVFVGYEGQQKAFDFLAETCTYNSGMALFQGPSLFGKTTLLRQFAAEH